MPTCVPIRENLLWPCPPCCIDTVTKEGAQRVELEDGSGDGEGWDAEREITRQKSISILGCNTHYKSQKIHENETKDQ